MDEHENGVPQMQVRAPKPSRFIRHIPEYEAFGDWCDRCRMWTTEPEKHRHEDPLY